MTPPTCLHGCCITSLSRRWCERAPPSIDCQGPENSPSISTLELISFSQEHGAGTIDDGGRGDSSRGPFRQSMTDKETTASFGLLRSMASSIKDMNGDGSTGNRAGNHVGPRSGEIDAMRSAGDPESSSPILSHTFGNVHPSSRSQSCSRGVLVAVLQIGPSCLCVVGWLKSDG